MNWIKKLFKKEKPDYRLKKCFDVNGVELFKFDNVLELPTSRRMALQMAIHDASLGITSEDLKASIAQMKDFAANKEFSKIAALTEVLEFYLSMHSSTNVLFNIAAPLILMSDEQPEDFGAEELKAKRLLFDTNSDVKAFFLHMAYIYLLSFSKQSIGHLKIEDYLNEEQQRLTEQMLLNLITKNIDLASEIR